MILVPADAAPRAASPIFSVMEAVVLGLMTSMSICCAFIFRRRDRVS